MQRGFALTVHKDPERLSTALAPLESGVNDRSVINFIDLHRLIFYKCLCGKKKNDPICPVRPLSFQDRAEINDEGWYNPE
jgi:hypothetical protein